MDLDMGDEPNQVCRPHCLQIGCQRMRVMREFARAHVCQCELQHWNMHLHGKL